MEMKVASDLIKRGKEEGGRKKEKKEDKKY